MKSAPGTLVLDDHKGNVRVERQCYHRVSEEMEGDGGEVKVLKRTEWQLVFSVPDSELGQRRDYPGEWQTRDRLVKEKSYQSKEGSDRAEGVNNPMQ